jgi:hypothetical protein
LELALCFFSLSLSLEAFEFKCVTPSAAADGVQRLTWPERV